MNRRAFLFVIYCLLASIPCTRALAQSLPPWLLVRAEHVASSSSMMLVEGATPEVRDSARRQSRARVLLALSAGLLLSSAVHFAYAAPYRAENGRDINTSMKIASAVGAVGLAGTIASATWLGVEAKRHGRRTSREDMLGSATLGALTAVLSQAALFGVWIGEELHHD